MRIKKLAAAGLAIAMATMSLYGCSSKTETPVKTEEAKAGSDAAENSEAGASQAANTGEKKDATYVIKYSHVQSTTAPTHQAMEWLKGWLEEQTDGDLTMEIFPAGQLYNDSTEIDAITAGNIDMISTYVSKLTTLDIDLQFSIAPFLFDDTKQMLAFYFDKDVQSKIFGKLDQVGITVLGAFYGGDDYLFAASKELVKPEDFKGLKVRENGGTMIQDLYKAIGASVVTVAYADLYTSMQTGLADVCSCTLDGVTGIALQEVLKYAINLDHQQSCYLIQVNTDFFNKLPAEYQDILMEGVRLASEKELEICDSSKSEQRAAIEEAGCVIRDASDEEKQAFIDIWQPIVESYVSDNWKQAIEDFKASYTAS